MVRFVTRPTGFWRANKVSHIYYCLLLLYNVILIFNTTLLGQSCCTFSNKARKFTKVAAKVCGNIKVALSLELRYL